jgi:uncharacterized protein (TIGR02099 family)
LWLQALFATIAIVSALLVGLVQIALPWIASHPQRISAFLSERLHRAVTVGNVVGVWERDGPLLVLRDVHVAGRGADMPASTIPQVGLKINFFSFLHRNQAWNEFRLDGLDLTLIGDGAGHWQLRGIDTGGTPAAKPGDSPLFALGALVLRDLRLRLQTGPDASPIKVAADEVRLVNSGSDHRVLARVRIGDSGSPVDVVADYHGATRDGELYLGGSALDLAAVTRNHPWQGVRVDNATGRVQLWTWWRRDRLARARLEADLSGIVLTTAAPIALDSRRTIVPRVGFDRITFGARWQREADGWSADVADLVVARQGMVDAPENVHVRKARNPGQTQSVWSLHADGLAVAAPASVVMLSDALPPAWRSWLYRANPLGRVNNANLRFAGSGDFDLDAVFDGLAWHAVDAIPGVTSLSGDLLGDASGFNVHLPTGTAFGVDEPRVLRQPLQFDGFSGDVAVWRTGEGWCIGTSALDFEGAGYGGQLRGSVQLRDDGSRPALDLYAAVTHAQVTAARLFWPINIMPPAAVEWLDRALVGGSVDGGRAVFRGDLKDWPFTNREGRFEARAPVRGARIAYLPDWPAAEQVDAVADFVDNGLRVDLVSARTLGNRIDGGGASIADLAEAVLDLNVTGSGSGRDLLGFLKATPIGAEHAGHLLGVGVGGSGKVAFHLNLPIADKDRMALDGTVILSKSDLTDAQYALRLEQANGTVEFSRRGFDTGPMRVMRNGVPATFRLAVGGFVADPVHEVEASLRGNFPAADLLAYAPMLAPWADRIHGAADWSVGFSADGDAARDPGQRVTVNSNLDGIAIDLPAPLTKAADSALPLDLTIGLPVDGGAIDLRMGGLMRVRGRMQTGARPFAARVDFGGDASAPLPASGFAIGGSAPLLDLSGWMDFAASGNAPGGGRIPAIDMQVQDLRAWDRDFGATGFTLRATSDGMLLGFDGASLAGNLEVPLIELDKRGVTAQFERLFWPATPEAETSATTGENPSSVPPLHIHIADFRLGDSRFGTANVESYPIAGGTHFEQVTTHSKNVEMRAHGDWTGSPGSDGSDFSIDFSAHNLGRLLGTFGYAGVIDGGATVAQIRGKWSGSPSMFSLDRLDGSLKVNVAEGRIPDADPGAGRLLGLINVSAIPRRLALDFGDFFKSGFSFDSIDGTFMLKDGNAYTTNLQVKGTAADIAISGRAGLKAKDYDQIMIVTPHIGGTLMIGGALVGGPVGAAAGAVLQKVFKKALNDVSRVRYSVTGAWDKPVITEIAKEKIKPAPATGKSSLPATSDRPEKSAAPVQSPASPTPSPPVPDTTSP